MAQRAPVIRQAFTELAPTYEATVDREVREFCGVGYREFIGQLAARVTVAAGGRVLDVASGTALSSLEIAAHVGPQVRIFALDITPAMQAQGVTNIAQAGRAAQISQICASAMALPCAATSFDAVICGLGTHHMDVATLLTEIGRALKPGGQVVLADIGAPARWRTPWGQLIMRAMVAAVRTFRRGARWQAESDAFMSIHTSREWQVLLGRYGFAAIQIDETRSQSGKFWHPNLVIITATKERLA